MSADIARETRGLLLALLAAAYPKARAAKGLQREIEAVEGDVRGWDAHVAYLTERGYLERQVEQLGAEHQRRVGIRTLKLTANGLDVVDGIVEDPGVLIPSADG